MKETRNTSSLQTKLTFIYVNSNINSKGVGYNKNVLGGNFGRIKVDFHRVEFCAIAENALKRFCDQPIKWLDECEIT